MFSERFGFGKRNNPKELTEDDSYTEPDPTTYSPLPLEGEMSHTADIVKGKIFTVGVHESGEYVELKENNQPKEQQAIARLVKGIIPVADIVSRRDAPEKRYSKVMPLEHIQQEDTPADVRAYLEFMSSVFGDEDRVLSESTQHNIQYENGKAVLFDFAGFKIADAPQGLSGRSRGPHTRESLTKLLELLSEFSKRLEGEEGKAFLNSVLRNSGVRPSDMFQTPFHEASIDDVYEQLIARTNRAEVFARLALRELAPEESESAK